MKASSGSALCPTRIRTAPRYQLLPVMTGPPLSESIQDYLKSIYKLQEADGRATIGALARDQGVSPASACAMVKKLAALDLLDHEPLSRRPADPRRRARRARGDPPPPPARALPRRDARPARRRVHDEADRLEHVISEELEARIDQALGYPTHDPHGDPIPDANLDGRPMSYRRLRARRRHRIESDARPPRTSLRSSSGRASRSVIAEYVIREHHRGRTLDEILKDPYVMNTLRRSRSRGCSTGPTCAGIRRRRDRRAARTASS